MLVSEVEKYQKEVIAWRRDFHMHPELGFQEFRTSEVVKNLLESFGLEVITGFAKTAVLGILRTGRKGNVVAVRADMDALHMQDEKECVYRSQTEGICHACGHDAHTANLLGVAKYVSEHKDDFCGTIKFLFQPAEEGPAPGGAKAVLDSGVLDDVDYIFAAHNTPEIESGKLMVRYGFANAGADELYITLKGKGCHGARPNTGNDLIVIAGEIIAAFQGIVSRETDPLDNLVISVCSIHAGRENATNVIPSELKMSGTIRTFDEKVRDYALQRIRQIVEKVCELHGVMGEVSTVFNMPSLCNCKEVTDVVKEACIEVVGTENFVERTKPTMGAEDFAYYTKKIKACNFYFGSKNEKRNIVYRGHHPKFDIEEECLKYSMAAFLTVIEKLMVK